MYQHDIANELGLKETGSLINVIYRSIKNQQKYENKIVHKNDTFETTTWLHKELILIYINEL